MFHAASGAVPADYMKQTRHYDDAEWRACEQRLAERGLLDGDGSLTAAGRELKDHIESGTDLLALHAFDGLDDDELDELMQALTGIARTVLGAGDLPAVTPMTIRRDF